MGSDFSGTDPRKVGIPRSLDSVLRRDMQQFEVLKSRDGSLAVNQFINALLVGYYEEYKVLLSGQKEKIREVLAPYIPGPKKLESVAGRILLAQKPEDDEARKTDGRILHFRPTGPEAVSIDSEIDNSVSALNMSLAGFYRNMFISYSRKPVYAREKIIFHDVAEVLESACGNHMGLTFSYRDNPGHVHTVIPYKLVHGSDEQFNYLLCQEKSANGKKVMAASYRLRRIICPKARKTQEKLDGAVKAFLDRMIRYDPQYPINEDQEYCVEFTEKGRKSFNAIYTGRPLPDEKGDPDAEGRSRYLFRCSREQLFNYFKRFNPGDARVVYPESLREDLRNFHRRHLEELGDEDV